MPQTVNGGNIQFGVGFKTDASGLKQLEQSLLKLQTIKIGDFKGTKDELDQVKQTVQEVQLALGKSFNIDLGTVNVTKFNNQLAKTGKDISSVYRDMSKFGAQGKIAFNQLTTELLTTNFKLKQTKSIVDSIGQTFMNSVKWNIASSVINSFTGSIQQAFGYVKNLDTSLTNIRIVTGDSREQMAAFAVEANKAAAALGKTTRDYTDAALSFYQQGLNDEEVKVRTEASLKAQNITQGQASVDELTAVWNGYQVNIADTQKYVDKLAAVADSSASDMSQLATAMSKVAATANVMGVDIDQLTAQIATIIATTRQAPQTVGNALKTIYARINDIKAGTDEAEVSLGNYSSKMAALGFNVLDSNGNLRQTGQVMEEIGERWETLTNEQQVYLAQTMAGQRQYNQLISLFDNWTQYSEMLNVSLESEGTLNEKNARYMESLAAHMEQFTAARQNLMDSLLESDSIKSLVDIGTALTNGFAGFFDSLGDGNTALLLLGGTLTSLFSSAIGTEINNIVTGFQDVSFNAEQARQQILLLQQQLNNQKIDSGIVDEVVGMAQAFQPYRTKMTQAQNQQYDNTMKNIAALEQQKIQLDEQKQKVIEIAEEYSQLNLNGDLTLAQNIRESMDSTIDSVDNAKLHVEQLLDATTHTEKATALDALKEDLKNIAVQSPKSKEEINALLQKLEQLTNKAGAITTGKGFALDILNEVNATVDTIRESTEAAAEGIDNTTDDIEGLQHQTQYVQANLKSLKENYQNLINQLKQQDAIQSVTKMIGGVAQAAAGLKAVFNIPNIWQNQNLSTGEKIFQSLTAVSTGLITVTRSVKMLKQGFEGLNKISTLIINAAMQRVAINNAEAASEGAVAAGSSKSLGTRLKNYLAAKIGKVDQAKTITGANGEIILSQQATASSTAMLMAQLLPFIAVAAAIGIAAYGIYKWYNKDADAAKKAAQATREANQHYQELKNTLTDFNNSISAYDDAVKALNELNKGTEEWNQKLKQTNDLVLQLLANYPQLSGAISQNADGLLTIDKTSEAYKSYLEDLTRQTQVANVARLGTQQKSNEADRTSQITNLSRSTDINRADLDKVINAMQHQGNAIIGDTKKLEDILGAGSPSIKAIQDNADKITSLATTIENNTKATEILGTTIAQDLLKDNKAYENSDYQSQFSDQVSNRLQNAEFNQAAYSYRDMQTGALYDDTKAIADRYAEILGTEVKKTVFGSGYKILDQQTGKQKKVTADFVKNEIAAADAMNNLDEIIQQTDQVIKQITNTYERQGEVAAALQFQNVKSTDDVENVDLTKMSYNDVNALDADFLASIYGWDDETVEAVKNKLEQSKDRTRQIAKQYAGTLDRGVREAFNQIDSDKMSGEMQTQVAGILKKVFVAGEGISGLEKQVAESLQSAIDADKLEELLSQNWDQINLDQAADIFNELGVEVPKSEEALQAFINALKTSVQELTAQEIYNNIHGIIDKKSGKTLKQGQTISAEDYQTLVDSGVDVEGFFQPWIDGTYKLKRDADEFYKAANSASLQPFYDQIGRLKEKVEKGAAVDFQSLSQSNAEYKRDNNGDITGLDHVNKEQFQNQIDALKTIGALTEEEYANYNNLNEKQTLSIQQTQHIAELIAQNQKKLEDYQSTAQQKLHDEQLMVAYGQQDIGELRDARNREDQPFDTLSAEEYAQAVLYASEAEGIQIQNVKTLVNLFSQQADTLDWVNDTLDEDSQAMYNVAATMEDMVSGIQSIQKTWKQTIKEGTFGEDWMDPEVIEETSEALSDMFNQDVDASFVQQHLEDIYALAQGDIDAVTDIGIALANTQLDNLEVPAGINKDQFYQDIDNLQLELLNASDYLNDLEVGTSIDDAPFYDALQQMIIQAGMTEEQANELLAGIGYDPKIQYQTVELGDDRLTKTEGGYKYHIDDGNNGGAGTDVELTEEMVSELTSGGQIRIPVIRGSKFAGGGKNLRNAGGSRVTPKAPSGNKGGGGGKKGGGDGKKGGGGGNKGSSKKPKTEKPKEDKTDPYHMVNRALDDQKIKLKEIQQLEDDGLLADKLKAIQEQNKSYEEQIKLLKQKENIANAEQARLKNEITSATNGRASDVQVKFTATGEIANYNQVLQSALDKYNNYLANVYNKYSAEEQELHAAQKEAKEKEYEQLKKNLEEYEKTLDTQDQIKEAIREAQRELTKLYITNMKYRLDARKSAGELLRDWQDFSDKVIKDIADDDYLAQIGSRFSKIQSYINSEEVKMRAEQISALEDELSRALNGQKTEHTIAQIQEHLEQLYKEQKDDLQAIKELQKEISEQFLDSLDNVKDKFDDVIDQYGRVNDALEYGADLTRKLFGDEAYNQLNKFSDQLYQNNLKTLQTLQAQRQWALQEMQNAQASGNQQAYDRAREMYEDIQDQLNDAILDTLDSINDWWDSKIEEMADKMTRALSGGFNDAMVNADWDRIGNMDDTFLDAVNRTYGVGQIERLYQSGVDSLTDSPKLQQRMNKLMNEQLTLLNEKDKLTQYDLDRAKALYDIEMKRYELEEARNNKTKMRLRRDSQGNYTYQYVEDEEKLSDLQDALAKAQNDLYNNDKEEYRKTLDNMYDTYQDYLKSRGQLAEQERQLETQLQQAQTDEEKEQIKKRLEAIKSQITDLDSYFKQYYNGLDQHLKTVGDTYLPQSISMNLDLDLGSMTEEEKRKLTETYVSFGSSLKQSFVDGISAQGGIVNAVINPLTNQLGTLTNDYITKVNEVLTNATPVEEQVKANQTLLQQDIQVANDAIKKFEQIKDLLKTVNEYLNNLPWQDWIDQLSKVTDTLLRANTKDENNKDTAAGAATREQAKNITSGDAAALQAQDSDTSGTEKYLPTSTADTSATDTGLSDHMVNAIGEVLTQDMLAETAAKNGAFTSSIGSLFNGLGTLVNNGTIEQHVEITANFPNATDQVAIENAILNVVNVASQKASTNLTGG